MSNQAAMPMLIFLGVFVRVFACLSIITPIRLMLRPTGILAVSFAFAVAAVPGSTLSRSPIEWHTALSHGGSNLLFGVLLGLPVALTLEALMMNGRLIEALRGAMFAEQLVPNLEERVCLLESLVPVALAAAILQSGGYQSIVRILITAEVQPMLSAFPDKNFWILLLTLAVQYSAQAILLGFLLAAPLVIGSLAVDSFLFIAGRALGRVHFGTEFLPLRLIGGLWLASFVAVQAPEALLPVLKKASIDGEHLAKSTRLPAP